MRYHQKSKIQKQDQFMWTPNIPLRYECSLQEIMEKDGYEMIHAYSCLYCQVFSLLAKEANDNFTNDEFENENIYQLKLILPTLKINSNILDHLLYYFKNHNKNRYVSNKIMFTIIKISTFSKPLNNTYLHRYISI